MEGKIEMSRMYETLLASPGMNQNIRVSLSVSRKTALLLNQLIGNGLAVKGRPDQAGIAAFMPEECFQQLEVISMELLRKAGLFELSEKLSAIGPGL